VFRNGDLIVGCFNFLAQNNMYGHFLFNLALKSS
jgi:hypothetical protein